MKMNIFFERAYKVPKPDREKILSLADYTKIMQLPAEGVHTDFFFHIVNTYLKPNGEEEKHCGSCRNFVLSQIRRALEIYQIHGIDKQIS
jgi:hypothetical protein